MSNLCSAIGKVGSVGLEKMITPRLLGGQGVIYVVMFGQPTLREYDKYVIETYQMVQSSVRQQW